MKSFIYKLRRKLQYYAFDILGAETMSKIYFRIVLKQKLHLDNPQTFNEKIQWYKLFYCPNNPEVIICSDKYRIREYLRKKNLVKYAIPLIGVWERTEEIPWNDLPDKFVLKCNHGCAYNIICKDKNSIDKKKIMSQLDKWLREDFGKFNAEIHYSQIKPRIVCEEYLGDGIDNFLVDYKIHCFNGEPRFVLICSDREGNKSNYNYYDLKWSRLDYSNTQVKEFKRPNSFDEMISISKIIANDFPFIRVDFYEINNQPIIGELTFVPAGGLDETLPKKADYEIGKMLSL